MGYAEKLSAISRTRITIACLTMDYCGRVFGTSPCLATGEKCYNTFPTCKYASAFLRLSKEYKFSSAKSPTSEIGTEFRSAAWGASPWGKFTWGEDGYEDTARTDLMTRPYLAAVEYLPTEIKGDWTVRGRVKCGFYDEPDTDVGIDPYLSTRSSIQGTFWKKFLARNSNYKGRKLTLYEGFLGLPETDFRMVWTGKIDSITWSNGQARIEAVDFLDDLAKVKVPREINVKLTAPIPIYVTGTTDATACWVDDASQFPDPVGYLRIGDEIMSYAVNDAAWGRLTVGRGAYDTVKADHAIGDAVQLVRVYALGSPFDILVEMLTKDAGLENGAIDLTAFSYWKGWPGGELPMRAVVAEPTQLDQLYFELVDLLNCKSWITENQQMTIRRNVPNEPGRAYTALSDATSLVVQSGSIDFNPASRVSRVVLYWEKDAIGGLDDPKSYGRVDMSVDEDAESAEGYGEPAEKKIFCRWLGTDCGTEAELEEFISAFSYRLVWYFRHALPLLTFRVEMKDRDVVVGDYVKLTTDEVPTPSGADALDSIAQVVKKQDRDNQVELTALVLPVRRAGFYAPDGTPVYASATAAQREYCFFSDDNDQVAEGEMGYFFW